MIGTARTSKVPAVTLGFWIIKVAATTLGTALGDFLADTGGLGYGGGALVFTALLAIVVLLAFTTRVSRTVLFWAAFILTRPLGATVGDLLDKPLSSGGSALSRVTASVVLAVFILVCVAVLPQGVGSHPGTPAAPP